MLILSQNFEKFLDEEYLWILLKTNKLIKWIIIILGYKTQKCLKLTSDKVIIEKYH